MPAARLPTRSGPVRVGVRPEKILLRPVGGYPTSEGENSIEATVTVSTYTGVSTSYECRTDDGATVVVYVQNIVPGGSVGAGARVRLSWDPQHTFAVEGNRSVEGGAE